MYLRPWIYIFNLILEFCCWCQPLSYLASSLTSREEEYRRRPWSSRFYRRSECTDYHEVHSTEFPDPSPTLLNGHQDTDLGVKSNHRPRSQEEVPQRPREGEVYRRGVPATSCRLSKEDTVESRGFSSFVWRSWRIPNPVLTVLRWRRWKMTNFV